MARDKEVQREAVEEVAEVAAPALEREYSQIELLAALQPKE